jgi:hypothetical protein
MDDLGLQCGDYLSSGLRLAASQVWITRLDSVPQVFAMNASWAVGLRALTLELHGLERGQTVVIAFRNFHFLGVVLTLDS